MSDDMKPREPNCECNVEEGDSSCPVHGDCAWCGGLSPGCCKDARIATLEADLARVTKERDRLLKLFDDAGQGEHNVLALVDYYQDQALTAGRERDALKAKLGDVDASELRARQRVERRALERRVKAGR